MMRLEIVHDLELLSGELRGKPFPVACLFEIPLNRAPADLKPFSKLTLEKSPLAYGSGNKSAIEAIAQLKESPVYEGTPEKVQILLENLFQTNL